LELGESIWRGIGKVFGVTLRPSRANVTGSQSRTPLRISSSETSFDEETFELLQERSAADAIVYDHVLMQAVKSEDERARIRGGAFASELVKYGELIGPAAGQTPDGAHAQNSGEIEGLRDELQRTRVEV
jgi:hypothetical protein